MKFWGALALLLMSTGCRAPGDNPAAERYGYHLEAREQVDRLRVKTEWHPAPMGGDCVSSWHELAPNAYIAQGWRLREACWRPRAYLWRPGCRPLPACD